MYWVWQVVLWIASTVATYLLTPRVKPSTPQPGALSDFNLPTVDEGAPVPVLRGTGLLRAPIIGWQGDYATAPFAEHDVVVGHYYYFGMDLVFCHGPIDEVRSIRFDGKHTCGPLSQTIEPGQVLRVEDGSGEHDVALPAGTYARLDQLAAAVTAAVVAEVPTFGSLVHAWDIPQGVTLDFTVVHDGVTTEVSAPVDPGSYHNGADLARMLTIRMRQAAALPGRVNPLWTYDHMSGTFALELDPLPSWNVTEFWIDPDSAILPFLGLEHAGSTVLHTTSFPAEHEADHAVRPLRYYFDLGADITIHWPDSNCRSLFGVSPSADQDEPGSASLPTTIHGNLATITDLGEFIRVSVDLPNLYGGIKAGGAGGVVGAFDVYKGTQTQGVSDYLAAHQAEPRSAHPGICHAVARQVLWGTQTVFRSVALEVRCTPNPLELTGGRERIGDDYNPGCMLWELLTDCVWGAGIPEELLDRAAFVTLANACAAEGRGGTWILDSEQDCTDACEAICREINAVPVVNPVTGLFGFALVRADYDPLTLPEVDESQLSDVRFSRPSWGKTATSVQVRYTSRELGYVTDSRTVHNEAAIAARGGRIETVTVDCPGITTAEAAEQAAWEQLAPVSHPLATLEADCDRSLWQKVPGGVFAFTSARLGITRMPMRTASLEGGTFEDGKLSVKVAEDVFGLAFTGFGADPTPFASTTPAAVVIGTTDTPAVIAQGLSLLGARLFGEAGLPVYGSTAGPPEIDPYEDQPPNLVADGAGGIALATALRETDVGEGIVAQRLTAAGARLWGANGVTVRSFQEDDWFSIAEEAPVVCLLGDAGLLVAWSENRLGNGQPYHLYAQLVSWAGVCQWDADGLIVHAGDYRVNAAVSDGAGGAYVIATDLGTLIPQVFRLDPAGGRLWGPVAMSAVGEHDRVRACPDGVGGVIVTQCDNTALSDAYLQRLDPEGRALWGSGVQVADRELTRACADGRGGCFALCYDSRAEYAMASVRRYSSLGVLLWDANLPTGAIGYDQTGICADGRGGCFATYQDASGGRTRTWVDHLSEEGLRDWYLEVSPDTEDVQLFSQVVPDGEGGVIVVWFDSADAWTGDVRAQRFDADGNALWAAGGAVVWPGVSARPHLVVTP